MYDDVFNGARKGKGRGSSLGQLPIQLVWMFSSEGVNTHKIHAKCLPCSVSVTCM